MASASSPRTPPSSISPSVSTSPSNHRLLSFPNPLSTPFSPLQKSSASSALSLLSPKSSRRDKSSDARQTISDDSDVEICLSALTIDNSVEESASISLGSIDSSFSQDARRPAVNSQGSLHELPSTSLHQTVPLPNVNGSYSDNHMSCATTPLTEQSQHSAYPSPPPINSVQTRPTADQEREAGISGTNEAQKPSTESLEALKTTNVYINGLPPHFPEDQLFALAAPYGPIRSVRTFTRHVKDNESGYGFVLFESVGDAEKCIQSLRKYRNLHPTFSKTVHKIPGTYSHVQLNLHQGDPRIVEDSMASHSPAEEKIEKISAITPDSGDDASFKAKMESLHDPTSTNLYMEGLPLSIDEPTLAALVSPHKISSSRFFQTRLSNPPRIIAFVRFETRAGAEEIIERLHGRMVRGWNDVGSRISVRFADTAEQRELRRAERSAREGDQSPARLTIAQASLLNLRGQELKSKPLAMPLPTGHSSLLPPPPTSIPPPPMMLNRGLSPHAQSRSPYSYEYLNGSSVNVHSPIHTHTPPFAVDYSLAAGRGAGALTPLSRTQTPVHFQGSPYHMHGPLPLSAQPNDVRLPPQMDPAMTALLDSLRTGGVPFHPQQTASSNLGPASGYNGVYSEIGQNPAHAQGLDSTSLSSGLHNLGANHAQTNISGYDSVYGRSRATLASSGYTATEEFIMRAHAESHQQLQYDLRQEQMLRLRQDQLLQQQSQLQNELQQSQRRRPPPLDLVQQQRGRTDSDASIAGIGVGVRGYRTQAAAITVPASYMQHRGLLNGVPYSPPSVINSLPITNDDRFSSDSQKDDRQIRRQQQQQFEEVIDDRKTAGETFNHTSIHPIHLPNVEARLSRDHNRVSIQQTQRQQSSVHPQHYDQPQPHLQSQQQQQPQSPQLFSQALSPNPNLNYHYYQQAHLRSLTLPQRQPPSASAQRHYQHNSMSVTVPSSATFMNQQHPNLNINMTNTHTNFASNKNTIGAVTKDASTTMSNDNAKIGNSAHPIDIYDDSASPERQEGLVSVSRDNLQFNSPKAQIRLQNQHQHFDTSRASLYRHSPPNQKVFEGDPHSHHHHRNQASPSLNEIASPALTTSSSHEIISPALTYSVHSPASTLSPATPFFGSFANANAGQAGHPGAAEQGKVQETAVGVGGIGAIGDVNIEFEDRKMKTGNH